MENSSQNSGFSSQNKSEYVEWTVHTPNLIKEISGNPNCAILSQPLNIFAGVLYRVAKRASELNDDELNALMIRLTLYSVADPKMPDYDPEVVEKYRKISEQTNNSVSLW